MKRLKKAITMALRREFTLDELQEIEKKMAAGEMLQVFSSALSSAIQSKEAEEYQDKLEHTTNL